MGITQLVVTAVLELCDEAANLLCDGFTRCALRFALSLILNKRLEPFLFFLLLLDRCFCEILNLCEYFLLLLVVTAEDVFIQDGTIVLLHFLLRLIDSLTVLAEIFSSPKVELLILEQLLAIGHHAHDFGGIRVALIVVDNFVKFLL